MKRFTLLLLLVFVACGGCESSPGPTAVEPPTIFARCDHGSAPTTRYAGTSFVEAQSWAETHESIGVQNTYCRVDDVEDMPWPNYQSDEAVFDRSVPPTYSGWASTYDSETHEATFSIFVLEGFQNSGFHIPLWIVACPGEWPDGADGYRTECDLLLYEQFNTTSSFTVAVPFTVAEFCAPENHLILLAWIPQSALVTANADCL